MILKISFSIILVLILTGCGDLGSKPEIYEAPLCPDHSIADLNEKVGDLANLLYRVDINQMLLIKGGSDRFHTTVRDHEALYEKSEIADITLSILNQAVIEDTIYSLFSTIDSIGRLAAPESEWIELTATWARTVETTLTMSDSNMALLIEKAQGIVDSLASNTAFSSEATALQCGMATLGRGYSDFASFTSEASDSEWIEFIRLLVSCGRKPWSREWYPLSQSLFLPGRTMENPFLGPISFFRLPEIVSAETGWSSVDGWAGGEGRIEIEIIPPNDSTLLKGEGLVVLLPESGPAGSYYQTFFMDDPKPLVSLPAGSYRLLLFTTGGTPLASPTIAIDGNETKSVRFTYSPFILQPCKPTGGRINAWVVDPSDGAHLNIPCNCPCPTEVWQGETIFQVPIPIDTSTVDTDHSLRRTG